ncbi:type IV secretory system conjugative DNA transfer family protein [Agrobacterium tumefaciens]|uniref:type IV secretory system conjugative DNA transfer family protein n=1 Tax=Agrobacterium tumefaciens TaxID=358 RepID=UPI00287D4EE8|nr:type IV secretory system conjugative DNA transfer family protein [Agrobacterium tumefaciens]MDS7594930.1 type IV secretory system conjugative DNA transfer family protein [Agrobacterium tumefaciens]
MTPFQLLKALVWAPVLAVISAALGLLFAAILLLADYAVHMLAGIEQGAVSHGVETFARGLPIVLGIGGLFAAFLSEHTARSVFGSARWAKTAELNVLKAKGSTGLIVGRDPDSRALLRYDGPSHLITMAPTRTGKGVGTIIPNLLMVDRSIICVDPKGENARIAGSARVGFGPVYYLDPFGVSECPSSAFNPFSDLDPNDPDIAEDAGMLADALVFDEPGTTGDVHWNEEAKALIAGLILMIMVTEPPHARHPATLRDYLTRSPQAFAELLEKMQMMGECDGLIARAANRHLGKSDREASGVLSSAQRHTHFLDSRRMKAVMQRSDFAFADLKSRVGSVFLVLPPDRLSMGSRWLRLLVTQSLMVFARDRRGPSGAPVLFLLDEFAALGRLTALERAMGLMAGYGVQLWPILQDIHQLRSTYGKSANTFLSNAAILQVFGVNDIDTAELMARTIGKTDVDYRTRSFSEGKVSSSEHVAARDLINADEIMRLPDDTMILLRQGQRPARATKLRYHADPEFRGLFDPG